MEQETIRKFLEDGSADLKKLTKEFFVADNDLELIRKADSFVSDTGHKVLTRKKVYRNDPCPCGSGKKFKKCCIDQAQ